MVVARRLTVFLLAVLISIPLTLGYSSWRGTLHTDGSRVYAGVANDWSEMGLDQDGSPDGRVAACDGSLNNAKAVVKWENGVGDTGYHLDSDGKGGLCPDVVGIPGNGVWHKTCAAFNRDLHRFYDCGPESGHR